MNSLLATFILAGMINFHGTKFDRRAVPHFDFRSQSAQPVIVVADGTPGWQHQRANKILDELNALLPASHPLLVAWFDAEPPVKPGFAVRVTNRELVMVRPRTSMKDAMEIGFAVLADAPRPRTMIVIAEQQFYPTSVPTGRLLEAARHSATRIYTIHLASELNQGSGSRHIGRSVGNAFLHIFERLVIRQRAYSVADTSRQLKLMSDATGGWACVAEDEHAGVACAAGIVARLEKP
jgi:hypothetical protein